MNLIKDKIESFAVLADMDSSELANKIIAAFEEIGIPVLLEHLSPNDITANARYRISTQSQFFENAMRIVDNLQISYAMGKNITLRQTEKIV